MARSKAKRTYSVVSPVNEDNLDPGPSKKRRQTSPTSIEATASELSLDNIVASSDGPNPTHHPEESLAGDEHDDAGWTKVEKRKAKKARKLESAVDAKTAYSSQGVPKFFYVNNEIIKRREAVGISDIRDLTLHLLGEIGPQSWLKIENRPGIHTVLTLLIPGILPQQLNLPPLPTSATKNPNLPIAIPLPPKDSSMSSISSTSNTLTSLFGPTQANQVIKTLFSSALPPPSAAAPVNEKPSSKPNPLKLPFLASTFSHAVPTRAPGDANRVFSVLGAFFDVPLTREERARRQQAAEAARKNTNEDKDTPAGRIKNYVLSPRRLLANGYPLPSYLLKSLSSDAKVSKSPHSCEEVDKAVEDMQASMSKEDGWIETPDWAATASAMEVDDNDGQQEQEIYAVDCEMCMTSAGKELTRCCLVSFRTGKVVFDMLVRPQREIVDYLTRWSGITAEALEGVTTTLADVQSKILTLLSPPSVASSQGNDSPIQRKCPILLGHSLESDLYALRLAHPLVIDTAILYHHPRVFTSTNYSTFGGSSERDGGLATLKPAMKPGLAWLTRTFCGRLIQQQPPAITPLIPNPSMKTGHDAEEDARACMELLQRKLDGPLDFGEVENKYETERLWDRLSRTPNDGEANGLSKRKKRTLRCAVVDRNNGGSFAGAAGAGVHAVPCANDEEVLQGLLNCFKHTSETAEPTDSGKTVDETDCYDFVWARFGEVAEVAGWTTSGKAVSQVTPVPDSESERTQATAEALTALDTRLRSLWAALPSRTAVVIFTGHGDPRGMVELQRRKAAFETAVRDGSAENGNSELKWSTSDVRALEEAAELAKRGLLFLAIK